MEDIELDIGGTKFKGVYIAILFSFASTIGGGIWAASEFFSRLEAQEEAVAEIVESNGVMTNRLEILDTTIATVRQQLQDNDVGGLQGRLAQLATNLDNIMSAQEKLLELREQVAENDKRMKDMEITVQKAESISHETGQLKEKIEKLEKEVEDLWNGMDYLANPLG